MSAFEPEYRAQGVVFVAVNTFEPPEAGQSFVDSSDLDYTWWWSAPRATEALGVHSVPAQIILDRAGKVAWTSSLGSVAEGAPAIRRALDAVLAPSR